MRFQDLNLPTELLHAVADLNFRYCTPIQAEVLPAAIAGRDIAGRAQTGTGKTAAFLLAAMTRLLRAPSADRRPAHPRVLILAPTRELAGQIARDARALGAYTPLSTLAAVGGSDLERQRAALSNSPADLLIATPGRLLDLQERGHVRLDRVEILVIDEADRMLDMGFIPDVRRIVSSTPPRERRQTMFFSATLTELVLRLAEHWTRDPLRVNIEPARVAAEQIRQIAYVVTSAEKFPLLCHLLRANASGRTLIFVNRRDTAERLADALRRADVAVGLLSGALSQRRRDRALDDFRAGRLHVLVATDVASRGLHVEGLATVVNFNIPLNPEDYVHRIGRTGRAGASGTAITFASEDEAFYLPPIEEFLGHSLTYLHPDPAWLEATGLPHFHDPARSRPAPDRSGRRPPRSARR
ncbi:MAG: DEAD/DEAH box helicase [Kiritimatiellae bacterium]|nr:DEAD/DEAH box helicase [Kiritimatiellia bacterium]